MGTSQVESFFDPVIEEHRSTLIEIGALLKNGVDAPQRMKLCGAKEVLVTEVYTLMGDASRTVDFSGWLEKEAMIRAQVSRNTPHTREVVARDVLHVLERTAGLVPGFKVV